MVAVLPGEALIPPVVRSFPADIAWGIPGFRNPRVEDGETPFRLNLVDDVADTDRPVEHEFAFGAADRFSWRAAWPQDAVCHCKYPFSFLAPSKAQDLQRVNCGRP
jgi:hypothetical protein